MPTLMPRLDDGKHAQTELWTVDSAFYLTPIRFANGVVLQPPRQSRRVLATRPYP